MEGIGTGGRSGVKKHSDRLEHSTSFPQLCCCFVNDIDKEMPKLLHRNRTYSTVQVNNFGDIYN